MLYLLTHVYTSSLLTSPGLRISIYLPHLLLGDTYFQIHFEQWSFRLQI